MSKNIFVLGGSKGIGRVFANERIKKGDTVYVFARTFESRDKYDPLFVNVDFTNQKEFLIQLKKISNKIKRVDYVLFAQRYRGNENIWQNEILTSIDTLKNTMDVLIPLFKSNSSVVVISSNASNYIATEQPIGYHMAKSAIIQMAKYYAVLLGNKNIRVNIVSPSITLKPENVNFYNKEKNLQDMFSNAIPLKRMAQAKDICNLINFLMSKQSSFITGQNIIIDGGLSLYTPEVLIRKEFKE